MIRHGMVNKTSAAGVTLPATDPHASVVIIVADRVPASLVAGRQSPVNAATKRPVTVLNPVPGCDRAIADMSRTLKSP
jgi:hypothetical protein